MYERMTDKSTQPSDRDMIDWIGEVIAENWIALRRFLEETYDIVPIFNSGGKRYGWNLQYRKGGRPLCEMYPEHGSFTALVIFGKSELDRAMQGIETFSPTIRQAIMETPRYHDGCWMYIRVSDPLTSQQDVQNIEELILINRKPSRKKTPTS
jgi:Protein of unknown function (DUF3788)